MQAVIDQNKSAQDAGYNTMRGLIDRNARYTMPATDQALNEIMQARQAAGWANPAQGLEQFRNVAGGATVEGAHRARVDARNAGDVRNPNPGYDAGDFNKLTCAMTQDLRNMVGAASRNTTPAGRTAARAAFDAAEDNFGRLAEQNKTLRKLVEASGETGIAKLVQAAREKGGNLALLSQLRNSMDPADFHVIGGQLLHELGQHQATGEFSLAKFVTEWNKVSDGAKRVLFSQQHADNINDIVGMGEHIKKALAKSNTSHTAAPLILLDAARDAIELGADVVSGGVSAGKMITGAALAAPAAMFGWWLASPAKAQAMSNWTRAYAGVLGSRTPVRVAAFNLATRNLAHNLGIPVKNLLDRIAQAQPQNQNNQPAVPRPTYQ